MGGGEPGPSIGVPYGVRPASALWLCHCDCLRLTQLSGSGVARASLSCARLSLAGGIFIYRIQRIHLESRPAPWAGRGRPATGRVCNLWGLSTSLGQMTVVLV